MTDKTNLAEEIAKQLLKTTGDALISGDFSSFQKCFHLPHAIITADGENSLKSAEDMKRVFDNVRAFHKRAGVTEFVRHSVAAVFSDAVTIKATHESRLLSKDQLVEEPYPVFSVIKKIDGQWVATSSEYALPRRATTLANALASKSKDLPNKA